MASRKEYIAGQKEKHGRKAVVVIAAEEFERITRPRRSLVQLMRESPLADAEIERIAELANRIVDEDVEPVDFDAPDGALVDILFVLVVILIVQVVLKTAGS